MMRRDVGESHNVIAISHRWRSAVRRGGSGEETRDGELLKEWLVHGVAEQVVGIPPVRWIGVNAFRVEVVAGEECGQSVGALGRPGEEEQNSAGRVCGFRFISQMRRRRQRGSGWKGIGGR
eukprot:5174237-Pleurochrysis_carterae.AAC.7